MDVINGSIDVGGGALEDNEIVVFIRRRNENLDGVGVAQTLDRLSALANDETVLVFRHFNLSAKM